MFLGHREFVLSILGLLPIDILSLRLLEGLFHARDLEVDFLHASEWILLLLLLHALRVNLARCLCSLPLGIRFRRALTTLVLDLLGLLLVLLVFLKVFLLILDLGSHLLLVC